MFRYRLEPQFDAATWRRRAQTNIRCVLSIRILQKVFLLYATHMSPEDMAMMGMPTDHADEKIFVATVPDKVHGAGVLAYQDFMDQAAERVGGECLGLRWEDLDFENKVISINHAVTYYRSTEHGRQLMSISLPKTEAGIRTIPMLDVVKEAFLMEKEQQFYNCLAVSTSRS